MRRSRLRRAYTLLPLLISVLLPATMTGQAAAAPPTKYSLAVSMHSDRSSAQPLSGAAYAQGTRIHVFVTPSTQASRVRFYLDDPTMSRAPRYVATAAPFDFAGTAGDGSAIAFDLTTLAEGSHTVTAAVETTNRRVRVVSATFSITSSPDTTSPTSPDTTSPTSPVLSATAGAEHVILSWTAASDDPGITRYEVWRDSAYVAGLSESARSYTVTGLTAGQSHTFRVVAYDAAGNHANSNHVTAAAGGSQTESPAPPPSGCSSPDAFPSRLRASGRSIIDANACVLPLLKGFNMHVGPGFTWSQEHFDVIARDGGRINRAVLHWDQFEPRQGEVADLTNLDQHIQRAAAAGIYTMLELHLNVNRSPSWATQGRDETEKYSIYGETLTKALALRYAGNPAVVGFGLNEPPLGDWVRNGDGSIPWLESVQRQMISWMRAEAPRWIGFVTYGYASATPIYGPGQNANAVNASATAYDAVGGNVVLDIHDYVIGCTNTDPDCDGRQWNGMVFPTWQGGWQLGTDAGSYVSSELRRSQQRAFLKPYKTFTTQANIPLMMAEWGWPSSSTTGELAWIADKKLAWQDAGTAIEIHWNYDVSSSNTTWAARPGGTWRPSVASWLSG